MGRRGENLPRFMARQLEFAAHIRHPVLHPAPADVDPRRMRVYVELFFNNVEALLASAFPVAKSVLGASRWPDLIRTFIHRHPSTSPYFPEVSQEFLQFINELQGFSLPGFIVELCHYEWVELGLGLADEAMPEGVDPAGDLYRNPIVRSPLAWPLSYAYPVHRIGPGYQPEAPGEQPTHLVVYRQRDERVRFMEVNALTQRLLLLLDGTATGAEALHALAVEVSDAAARSAISNTGMQMLERLRSAEVLLGVRDSAFGSISERDLAREVGPAGDTLE